MTPIHRSTPCLVFLLTVLIIVQYLPGTYSSWINAADLVEALSTLKDDQGLGVLSWQRYLDTLKYDVDLPGGASLASSLAAKLGRQIDKQVDAIKKLKQTIESNYATFSPSTSPSSKCCETSGLVFDASFSKGVDKLKACELISESAPASSPRLSQVVVDAMKTNLEENPRMKWQYFGSKDGVMTIYPASGYDKCGAFDPRYRPWYVEASTPITKEVVIVIDNSKSMEDPAAAPLMDIAKDAAVTVLGTMAANDLVGVVGFNDQISTLPGCFSDTMAMASRHNLKRLKEFVKGLRPSGSTSYMKSLQKAFALLQSNRTTSPEEHGSRAKVILFITDGVPKEKRDTIMTEIKRLQGLQGKQVIIMTYGLGEDLSTNAISILQEISNATGGKFERIDTPSKLRGSMASYYEIFNAKTTPANHSQELISLPYYDAFGLGIVTTVTVPVHEPKTMSLVGVVGIDIPLNDLFSDVFHRHYLFVIDLTGRAWRHPLLPDAREGDVLSTNINIKSLERNAEAASVIQSMKQSETGEKTFISHHLISMGDPFRDGIVEQNLNSTYYWNPVPGYNLSLCLVTVISADAEKEVADSSVRENAQFVYHRSDIVEPPDACRHFQRLSTMQAAIKFSPECYLDPSKYLNEVETKETVDLVRRYMTYESVPNPGFTPDIRPTAAMTSKADDIWVKKLSKIQKYIIWRYIGTYNGIVRFVPLAKIDKAYNPTLRPWYRRALSQPGKSVFSTPYLDAFGAGFVVTLSHTLYLGSEDRHGPGDTIIGVLGADFTLEYFYKLIGDTFPKCQESGFSCYVLDNSGYLIIHQDFVEAKDASSLPEMEYMHVTVKDSVLAESLIEDGYMTMQGCIDVRQMRDQLCWKLDLGSLTSREFKSIYEVSAVENSNIFIVIKKNSTAAKPCACSRKSIDSVDTYQCAALGSCQCPCYRNTTYSACEDKLHVNSTSFKTCAPKAPSLTVTPPSKEEKEKARTLKFCYQEFCDQKRSKGECTGLLGCSWCRRNRDGELLDQPYCGAQEKCYLGVEGLNPYNTTDPVGPTHPPLSIGAIVGIAIGVLAVVVLVGLVTVLILKHRGVISINNPCPKKSTEPPSMRITNADSQASDINYHRNSAESPYAKWELELHFDPVVTENGHI